MTRFAYPGYTPLDSHFRVFRIFFVVKKNKRAGLKPASTI